ncbi:MAG: glycosyltransferase [Planctomycetota bacterium]|nr:MAG: glycosyltransferase [Planctomycetota bacterium]
MHIVHVIRDLDASSGGPSRSVPRLASIVAEKGGGEASLLFQNRGGPRADVEASAAQHIPLTGMSPWNGRASVNAALSALHRERPIDVIHSHGIWSLVNHWACRFARRHAIATVISPRGMLDRWCLRHKRIKKVLAMAAYQRGDLASADCLHATASHEAHAARELGLTTPCAIVPNGVDFDLDAESGSTAPARKKAVLFLGRLHPQKGLANLVHAWSQVEPSGWRCVIAGPDEVGHLAELKRLVAERGLADKFEFVGEVAGKEKGDLLRTCSLLVLPSYSENFGIAAAEALAHGLPVITTKGSPWRQVAEEDCGWWIDVGSEPLARALREATRESDAVLRDKGRRGQQLIEREFTWPSVAERMNRLYRWLLHQGPTPEFLA